MRKPPSWGLRRICTLKSTQMRNILIVSDLSLSQKKGLYSWDGARFGNPLARCQGLVPTGRGRSNEYRSGLGRNQSALLLFRLSRCFFIFYRSNITFLLLGTYTLYVTPIVTSINLEKKCLKIRLFA